MRCPDCHGTGSVFEYVVNNRPEYRLEFTRVIPCPACDGSGLAHCCEGERPDNAVPRQSHPLLL
jgi:DnaJ-class molecular chaperone